MNLFFYFVLVFFRFISRKFRDVTLRDIFIINLGRPKKSTQSLFLSRRNVELKLKIITRKVNRTESPIIDLEIDLWLTRPFDIDEILRKPAGLHCENFKSFVCKDKCWKEKWWISNNVFYIRMFLGRGQWTDERGGGGKEEHLVLSDSTRKLPLFFSRNGNK